ALPWGPMSARQLVRQQAIEFQRGQREFGEIALLQPVSTKMLVWLLAAVVTIAIVFLGLAQFSRKQTVSGFLTPSAGTLKIFPNAEGAVSALYVKEGQQESRPALRRHNIADRRRRRGRQCREARRAQAAEGRARPSNCRRTAKRGLRKPALEHGARRHAIRDRRSAGSDRSSGPARAACRGARQRGAGAARKRLHVGGREQTARGFAAGAEAKSRKSSPPADRRPEQARRDAIRSQGIADRDRAQDTAA